MSLFFIAGALWLANFDSMQSAYHSLEDSSPLNRLFRQKAKESEDQPETVRRIVQDMALNYTFENHGAIASAIYRVAIVAFVLRFCDMFVGSAAFVWCVLAAMVADYALGISDWKPGKESGNLSTLLSAWSWIATVYLTFVNHLHNDASDHDQVRVFLTGIYLNALFFGLIKLLSHCHSVFAFVGVGLFTVTISALSGTTAWVRRYCAGPGTLLTRLDQCVLYATKLLLYRLNTTCRLPAGAGGGYLAPVPGLRPPKPGTPYRYTALSADQVRVLAIIPGHPSDPIRCRLDIVSLEEQPVYQAASYVWGRGELSHWVIVEQNGDETVLDVTANAHALLAKIRSLWEERVIWIDGLCINQRDNMEKTAQVKMMEKVYRGAWRVIAYLGPSPAAPLVQALLARIRFLRQGCGMPFPQVRDKLVDEYDKPSWEAISAFLRNEWFSRVWIVQEAALAARLHLLYGDICMDWEILNQSAEFLVQDVTKALFRFEHDNDVAVPGSGSHIYRGLDGICVMLELRGDFEAPDKMTLGLALESSLSFNVTDPRDKVFGFLSLVNDSKVTADYDLDCHDVYRDTMRHILVTDGNIEALNFAGHGRREPTADLPSWVSDWKRISQSGLYNKSYSAATAQQASLVSVPDHPNILFVKGWMSDTVDPLSDILEVTGSSASPPDLAGLTAFHNTAKAMTIQHATSYPLDQRFEVYIRTMIGDRSSNGTPPTTTVPTGTQPSTPRTS
ncbi:heterokaryon incompatibility protein-domain-containing protein [Podospora aff. communis PSN243]|uniref:Heterokaryon incompatibility protein-domain-containing protein n=1 Tax=Podospora aff. communis PSN243 TaxID=3040156 RepID=A0AAV9H202_9PEZI|nr:heterokaryon incompatibility protein-domain-containing protein [Podospora aff. communis PSN243]